MVFPHPKCNQEGGDYEQDPLYSVNDVRLDDGFSAIGQRRHG